MGNSMRGCWEGGAGTGVAAVPVAGVVTEVSATTRELPSEEVSVSKLSPPVSDVVLPSPSVPLEVSVCCFWVQVHGLDAVVRWMGEDTGDVCMDVMKAAASEVCVLLGVVMMMIVDDDVVHVGVCVDDAGREVVGEEGETAEIVDVGVSSTGWCLCECLWDKVWCLCLPVTLLGVVLCACSSVSVLGMGWGSGEWDWAVEVGGGMVETGTMAAIREEARAWIDLCWATNPV
ncbi:hypothetical protein NDU88_002490 [Pleurodeles waltl]|uniref:Uncharacterized protein n=1 Tax=Pleurodeles waltl TaxID=8319 RepID=A0AAV7TKV3_PLEWA|nr:hypothetical protein NDU88_002490 [Pleurodeles waltl]